MIGHVEITEEPCGFCPVQAFGYATPEGGAKQAWYFRARGEWWTITVGREHRETHPTSRVCDLLHGGYVDDEDAVWSAEGEWGDDFAAGYMLPSVAMLLITEALERFCRGEPPWKAPKDLHYTDPFQEQETT
jgi:hypothetical protein